MSKERPRSEKKLFQRVLIGIFVLVEVAWIIFLVKLVAVVLSRLRK